jgi:hypothetical protein
MRFIPAGHQDQVLLDHLGRLQRLRIGQGGQLGFVIKKRGQVRFSNPLRHSPSRKTRPFHVEMQSKT